MFVTTSASTTSSVWLLWDDGDFYPVDLDDLMRWLEMDDEPR